MFLLLACMPVASFLALFFKLLLFLYFQSDYKRVDGPFKSGPFTSMQHTAPTNPWSNHSAPSDAFLTHHTRIWITSHSGSSDSSSCEYFRAFKSLTLISFCHVPFYLQNYLNESLKFLEKSYPSNSLGGIHSSMPDTKPIYIDTKSLLGNHHQSGMHDKK